MSTPKKDTNLKQKLDFFQFAELDKQQLVDALIKDIDDVVQESRDNRQTICIKTINKVKNKIRSDTVGIPPGLEGDNQTSDNNDSVIAKQKQPMQQPMQQANPNATSQEAPN